MNKLSRIAVIVILTLNTIPVSHAYYASSSSQPMFDLNNVFGNINLSNPLSDFINSAKQIGSNVGSKISSGLNVGPTGSLNITAWFEKANNWFYNLTGVSILGFLKGILDIIIWILTKILAIFKWFESVI